MGRARFPDTCKYCIVSTSSQWREAGGLGPAPTKRRKQMDHRTAPQSLLAAGLSRPPRPTEEEMAIRWRTLNIRTTSRKQKEETPPVPVVEEETKEEKASWCPPQNSSGWPRSLRVRT